MEGGCQTHLVVVNDFSGTGFILDAGRSQS